MWQLWYFVTLLIFTFKQFFIFFSITSPDGNRTAAKCCSGLCIDLLTKFEDELGFTYDLVRTPDPKWGTFEVSYSYAKSKPLSSKLCKIHHDFSTTCKSSESAEKILLWNQADDLLVSANSLTWVNASMFPLHFRHSFKGLIANLLFVDKKKRSLIFLSAPIARILERPYGGIGQQKDWPCSLSLENQCWKRGCGWLYNAFLRIWYSYYCSQENWNHFTHSFSG